MIASAFKIVVLAFVLVVALAARPSYAQTISDTDRATARELGREGLAALDAGDMARADERLSKALALLDVPTLRLARARALRGLGRLVAASEDCEAALRYRLAPKDPTVFKEAQENATRELAELEPLIPRLTIQLSGAGGTVRVDGVEWPPAMMGVARPLDPGEHRVEVAGGAGQVATQRVTLAAGQREVLTLTVPSSGTATPAAVPGVATAPGVSEPSSMTAPPGGVEPSATERGSHTATYVAGGVTIALTAAAVITGILALSAKSDFDDKNTPDVPKSEKTELRDKASTLSWVNTALVGAALVGGGVSTYLIVTSSDENSAGRARPTGFVVGWRGQL